MRPSSLLGNSAAAGAILLVLYLIGLAIQRLNSSPVAKFPGPKLAALSFWYEFYYDVICCIQYCFKIDNLHDAYGTVVPRPRYGENLGLQVPYFVSTPTNFVSAIQTSMTSSTADQARNAISGGGR